MGYLACLISIAHASKFVKRLTISEINDLEIKLLAHHEVYSRTTLQALRWSRAYVRPHEADL